MDTVPPRMYWAAAGMILSGARSDAAEKQRAANEAKSRAASARKKH